MYPIASGAEPPPPNQPIVFIQPAALPRASGGTTSKSDAKILPSYNPLKKPQNVRATIIHPTEFVKPHSTTKGAPQISPNACTMSRPPGHRARSASASQPPNGDPVMLANWAKTVAVRPAVASFMLNLSYRNLCIHERSTTATK